MDPEASPFAGAFPVALAATAQATSAAGFVASQLVEAVGAPEVGQAYPAARPHLAVLPGLLLPRPDLPPEAAPALQFPLQARVLP